MQWILGIALTAGIFFVLRRWETLTPENKKAAAWKAILMAGGVFLLVMVLTGRIHVLTAALAALILLLRKIPALVRYLPLIQRTLFGQAGNGQTGAGNSGEQQGSSRRAGAGTVGAISEREACEILGVAAGCSRSDIIMAHRRLMQKIHPDRGGNSYLAAKVNAAKEVLLPTARS